MGFNGEYRRVVTQCFLVRHGEIGANVERLWHGSTDSELTSRGQQQVAHLGRHFSNKSYRITGIYSSPLKRTMSTAQAIADQHSMAVSPVPGLIEFGVGEWEGLSYEVIASEHGFFDKIALNQDFSPNGGESVNQVAARMHETFFSLVDQHRGEKIVLVGHGAAFAILMAGLLEGAHYPFFDHHMSNTGISLLEVAADNAVRRAWFDETGHLPVE